MSAAGPTPCPRVLLIGGRPELTDALAAELRPFHPELTVDFLAGAAHRFVAPVDVAVLAADLDETERRRWARELRAAFADEVAVVGAGPEAGGSAGVERRWPGLPAAVQLASQLTAERQARRTAEDRYQSLFDGVPVGLYRTTPAGLILDANLALVAMLGYPDRASLLAVNAVDLYVDPLERLRWQTLMRQGAGPRTFETRFYRRDQTVIWVANTTQVVHSGQPDSVIYEGILEDITDRKTAEQALSEGEERFRTIVSQAPLGIQVMTPDGWTLQVNTAWEKLWGVTAADVRGYNMLADDQARSLGMMPYVERGFAGEDVLMPPVAYHTPESLQTGRKRWFQARIYPVKEARGGIRNVIMMYEDITERQWAAEDAQRLAAELLRAQEAERKRISEELHDELGQALTAIRINVAALERDLGAGLGERQQARLTEAGALVDEVLERIRELAHALRPAMLDELGLLPTLRYTVSRAAERLGIEIKFEAGEWAERPAAEVETVLYRSVQEALTNIARHAQAHQARLRVARRGARLTALIEDDGVGFDAHRLATAGPAMGLRAMRERVALLAGTVTLETAPGQGTRVLIDLPFRPRPAEAA